MCGLFGYTSNTPPEMRSALISLNMARGARRVSLTTKLRNFDIVEAPRNVTWVFPTAQSMLRSGDYMLGHCQQPTGADAFEAHPFRFGEWFVSHNGHIHNDIELLPTSDWPYETDSRVLPYIISSGFDRLSLVDGIFACWAYNILTQKAYVFRWASPLYINEVDEYFSSIPRSSMDVSLPEGIVFEWPKLTEVSDFKPIHHPYKK